MPRPLRPQIPGGLYHVTTRANLGRLAFRDDVERARFLALVDATVRRCGWSCQSYCVLSTHYHLLVETPSPNIADGMQFLNGRYAQWANWSREEHSHIFGDRYGAVVIETDAHLLETHRYIAMNPVRAGIAARPEDWPWSSTRALLGLEAAPGFLDLSAALAPFGAPRGKARSRLRRFLEDGMLLDAA